MPVTFSDSQPSGTRDIRMPSCRRPSWNAVGSFILIIYFLLMGVPSVPAEEKTKKLTIQEWVDLFVESCVGAGSSSYVSGSAKGGLGFSLKKFKADGSLEGEFEVTKSNYRLLTEGISSAMTKVAAEQADKVRVCLRPLRQVLANVMKDQLADAVTKPKTIVHVLGPHEERIMKMLATTEGFEGRTGTKVAAARIIRETRLSDILFRVTVRMLQSKKLVEVTRYNGTHFQGLGLDIKKWMDVVSFLPDGETHVLRMGYVK